MKLRTWLQGAGVAALVLFPFYRSLLNPAGEVRMHSPVSASSLALSLVANLILVVLLCVCVFLSKWLRATPLWALLRFLLPALVLAAVAETVYIASTGGESTRLLIGVLLVTLFLSLLLHLRWHRTEQKLLQLSGAILVGLGFFCIFVFVQLLRWAAWHPLPNSTGETITETTNRAGRPRIIWILFDELSYQQVFGDRYPNLQLPNFDEFRKSSTLFTDAQPIINFTELAIPSVLLGQPINRVTYTTANQLRVGGADGPLFPFDAARTPFAKARNRGLTTGVVGWYNAYCGILLPYLNQCYWTNGYFDPVIFARRDFWQNLVSPWVLYGRILGHPRQMLSKRYRADYIEELMMPVPEQYIDKRIRNYHDLMQHGIQMLEPSGPDFVFLHLPLPHPPGFYNRKTQQFDASGKRSYIDNVALTDRTLGELLEILRKSPRWKDTSVVICGDHSWRVYTWRGTQDWTPEDEAASHGGVFDPRPLLMVHLTGQTTPATVNEPFPLLRLHNILNDLVTGKQPTFPVH
jgi:hypothetical protein